MVDEQKVTSKSSSFMRNNTLFISGDTNVLQPQEIEAFIAANKELNTINNYISEIRKKGEEFFKERYNIGFQDGKEEGSFEHLLKVFGTIFSSISFIGTIETTLIHVITQAVYKIVGDIGKLDHIHDWIQDGLNAIKNTQRIVVRIAPGKKDLLLSHLERLKEQDPEKISFISVVPDESVHLDKCILESELGTVLSNLDIQVRALEQVIGKHVTVGV